MSCLSKQFIKRDFIRGSHGGIAIEAAFIIPVMILITFAAIEFGMYYIKAQGINNTINSAINPVQADPDDPSIHSQLVRSGGSFLDLMGGSNYVCARSYVSYDQALNGSCQGNIWNTSRPAGTLISQPYYVALAARTKNPIDIFFGLSNVQEQQVIKVGSADARATCGDRCARIGGSQIQWGNLDFGRNAGYVRVEFESSYEEPPVVTVSNPAGQAGGYEHPTYVSVKNVTADGFQATLSQSDTLRGGAPSAHITSSGWQAIGAASE